MSLDLAHPYWNETGTATYVNNREAGFGTDPDTRARFAVVAWVEWGRTYKRTARPIKGDMEGREKEQTVYRRPLTVEYEIVTTYENYKRLEALDGSTQNLILPVGATIHHDGEYDVPRPLETEEVYLLMRNVKLMEIVEGSVRHYEQGRTRATIRFKKRAG